MKRHWAELITYLSGRGCKNWFFFFGWGFVSWLLTTNNLSSWSSSSAWASSSSSSRSSRGRRVRKVLVNPAGLTLHARGYNERLLLYIYTYHIMLYRLYILSWLHCVPAGYSYNYSLLEQPPSSPSNFCALSMANSLNTHVSSIVDLIKWWAITPMFQSLTMSTIWLTG